MFFILNLEMEIDHSKDKWLFQINGLWNRRNPYIIEKNSVKEEFSSMINQILKSHLQEDNIFQKLRNGVIYDNGWVFCQDIQIVQDEEEGYYFYIKWTNEIDGYGNLEISSQPLNSLTK